MINGTIILLSYYYHENDHTHRLLKYVKNHMGVYLPFNLYLSEPLQNIFSKVIIYDYLKRMTEIGVKAVNQEIIDLVRKEHPRYVLWTSWQYDIQESTLEQIRNEGTLVVGWFFDDEIRFDNYSKWWIPYLDYCVTNALDAVPKYKSLNAQVIHTIPNTGVSVAREWKNIEEKYEVSFVGSRNCADRQHYIDELRKQHIPVHLSGEGWGKYISFDEMIDIFYSSKINLNFSRASDWKDMQLKGRIFQVCMAGGFLLTEYAPGTENYFEIDKEIVCFRNAEEMIDKITYYLNHESERRIIAQAGWKRANSEYTSFHMVSKVFIEIEKDSATKDWKNIPHSPKPKIPMYIRRRYSVYHFEWGRALLEENFHGLWKDALELSIKYNPFNIGARYYSIVSVFPQNLRPLFFKIFEVAITFYQWVYFRIGSLSVIRRIKQFISKKCNC